MPSRGGKLTKAREPVLRTFLFSYIVSSTGIRDEYVRRHGTVQGNEKYRQEVLEPHDRRLSRQFTAFDGEVRNGEGDSYFVTFRDARQAIECAVAVQESLATDPIGITVIAGEAPRHVQVRIGIHTGRAVQIERGGRPNYDDHSINIAHRIQEHATPGGILTSRETWNEAGEIDGIRSAEHSGYKLKGVKEPWALVEVLWGDREPQTPSFDPSAQKLGFEAREVTVMFADLSGVFAMSRNVEPEALTSLANRYLSFIVEQVEAHGGYVDRFLGDAVVAMWGAPAPDTAHAAHAVRAALAAVARIRQEHDGAEARGETGFSVKIGLNSGSAVVGSVGTESRYTYTAVGEMVNVASRLESVPSLYGCYVVIGPRTAELIEAEFLLCELDWIRVRGGQDPIAIFEPIVELTQATPEQIARARRFAEGLAHYRASRFVDALAIWDSLAQEKDAKDGSQSGAAVRMAARAREFTERPPQGPWDAVWERPR